MRAKDHLASSDNASIVSALLKAQVLQVLHALVDVVQSRDQ